MIVASYLLDTSAVLIAATALAHGWTLVTNDHDLARAVAAVVPVQPLT